MYDVRFKMYDLRCTMYDLRYTNYNCRFVFFVPLRETNFPADVRKCNTALIFADQVLIFNF